MQFDFFQQFFQAIDGSILGYIRSISSNVNVVLVPIVSGFATCSMAWMTINTLAGVNDRPWEEFVKRILVMASVTAFGGAAGIYQQEIAQAILTLPESVSLSLIGGDNTAGATFLDKVATTGLDKAGEAWKKMLDNVLYGIGWAFAAVVYAGVTGYMVIVGGSMIMISKIMVGLLAALGPIFIYALLFNAARQFFANWVNQILYYSCYVLMFSVVYGFFINMFDRYTTGVAWDGNIFYTTAAAAFIAFLCYRVNDEIPRIAASLTSGFHIGELKSAAVSNKQVQSSMKSGLSKLKSLRK